MATRSTINLKTEEGIKSIYCHFDGYPEHHLPILTEHYDTFEKVEDLINLGNLSVLAESIECPEGHTFDNNLSGYCVAYSRDGGEQDQEYYLAVSELDIATQSYNYLFEDNKWKMIREKNNMKKIRIKVYDNEGNEVEKITSIGLDKDGYLFATSGYYNDKGTFYPKFFYNIDCIQEVG